MGGGGGTPAQDVLQGFEQLVSADCGPPRRRVFSLLTPPRAGPLREPLRARSRSTQALRLAGFSTVFSTSSSPRWNYWNAGGARQPLSLPRSCATLGGADCGGLTVNTYTGTAVGPAGAALGGPTGGGARPPGPARPRPGPPLHPRRRAPPGAPGRPGLPAGGGRPLRRLAGPRVADPRPAGGGPVRARPEPGGGPPGRCGGGGDAAGRGGAAGGRGAGRWRTAAEVPWRAAQRGEG